MVAVINGHPANMYAQTVASRSSGRHPAPGSGDSGFKFWLYRIDVESLGKSLYVYFLTPLICRKST